jgi:hypothetical protein
MRGHRPIPQPRRKNPQRMMSARVDQTRLDDVILPVFCPTCQTNQCAAPKLIGRRTVMTPRTDRKPRGDAKPRNDKDRAPDHAVIEQPGESADGGRDLARGEGGTIDLPARPGDLSKDD